MRFTFKADFASSRLAKKAPADVKIFNKRYINKHRMNQNQRIGREVKLKKKNPHSKQLKIGFFKGTMEGPKHIPHKDYQKILQGCGFENIENFMTLKELNSEGRLTKYVEEVLWCHFFCQVLDIKNL